MSARLASVRPATYANLTDAGVAILHHFGGDKPGQKPYIKEARIPAGAHLIQHRHDHDHLAVLVGGSVILTIDDVPHLLTGYQTLLIEAGKMHGIEAVTDTIWLCVWATADTDPATVDTSILKGD